ncbi:DegT/DnrJ/EryC1/StrS family aminotransferase [Candidatus Planktophila dulcis]|uniref:DegT/DnrJ/EryC1/StrS family aminotransferase n=1 Tax=Candidatus Planktophila dulcis TaxID=1884914 RepID=UPI003CF73B3E
MRLSQPVLDRKELKAVRRVLKSEFLGMGKEVSEFEALLSDYFSNQVLCVNTGTSALQLALSAAGVGAGDEVLVPSLTYVATYQAISAIGAIPVSCDVQINDLQIDIVDAGNRLTSKTRAVVPVYFSGATTCLERVEKFSFENGLINIPDAAHALGSMNEGKLIGSGQGTNVFSLDGIKNITSGEGGLIVSSDPEVIQNAKDARLLGVIGDSSRRASRERSWDFDVRDQGWRFHMSDVFAAIGKVQLSKLENFARIRKAHFSYYSELLAEIPEVTLFDWDINDGMVPHVFVIRIPGMTSRESLRSKLLAENIPTGIHYKPNHLLSFYKNLDAAPLVATDQVFPEILTLPLHTKLTKSQISDVTMKLRKNLAHAFE